MPPPSLPLPSPRGPPPSANSQRGNGKLGVKPLGAKLPLLTVMLHHCRVSESGYRDELGLGWVQPDGRGSKNHLLLQQVLSKVSEKFLFSNLAAFLQIFLTHNFTLCSLKKPHSKASCVVVWRLNFVICVGLQRSVRRLCLLWKQWQVWMCALRPWPLSVCSDRCSR